MVQVFQSDISAEDIKAKARALGADLVGIADGEAMNQNPPDPENPRRPKDISDYDADRVIVLAKRINSGTTRIKRWDERHKYYNDELAVTALEETALELVLWLENQGYPALIVPPTHVDPWRYGGDPEQHMEPLLSLEHAAVEAGMGTLGLNLQLLTPEYGPRVVLSAVLTSAPVETGAPMQETLCHGPECGRCLQSCPGDVIGHWDRDWEACDSYRSPHGFKQLSEFLIDVMDEGDPEAQKAKLRSRDSFDLWQSILRGSGVITGCRRCADVCPVGEDYQRMLHDAVDEIPEATPEKAQRLEYMRAAEGEGARSDSYERQARWIGDLAYTKKG